MSRDPNQAPRRHTGAIIVLSILMALLIAGSGFMIHLCLKLVQNPEDTGAPSPIENLIALLLNREEEATPELPEELPTEIMLPEETTEETTEPTLPEPEHVVSTATIAATGDILMHMPVVDTGRQSDGSYDFDTIFRFLEPYTSSVDYAVANLETTLCGTDNGYPYHGYANFNCPDAIAYDAAEAGFDMLLTANDHSYDTGIVGYKRTISVVQDAGMTPLGTMSTPEDPKYVIQEINGIRIGMLCYTYAYSVNSEGSPSLNGMPHISEPGICNYFHKDSMDAFYTEVDGYLQEMEAAGAEATIMFIHWGVEYQTYANDEQKAISQKLCDLGIDVIIGGHPHVVQPVSLLQSTVDPDHKTVCLYSMGNAVSNQRHGNISYISTAHTEDGVLFSVTFAKYSDGTVYLEGVDLIPCWVNRHYTYGKTEYNILPLDPETRDTWKEDYELTDATLASAEKSFNRTMAIVEEGLILSQEYLAEAKELREQYYYDLVYNPDKINQPTQSTEPPVEETTGTE